MTDGNSIKTPSTPKDRRSIARQLAHKLDGETMATVPTLCNPNGPTLSAYQIGLAAHARGTLLAIANGIIPEGRSSLRKDLVNIIRDYNDRYAQMHPLKDDSIYEEIIMIEYFSGILEEAAAAGLTAGGLSLARDRTNGR